MVSIQLKDVEDLCQFLELELPSLDKDVIESMRRHKIDGVTFLQLNEEYLRELAPLLSDRMKLKRIVTAGFEAISSQTVESAPKHNLVGRYSHDSAIVDLPQMSRLYLQWTPSFPATLGLKEMAGL